MVGRENYDLAKSYFDQGYKLQMDGMVKEAIDNYRISIDLYPTAEAYTYLGWAYSMQGEYEKAIEQCRYAIELDPDFGNPYNDIGSYLIKLKRYEEAVPWLEQAGSVPNYIPRHYPYINLGHIREKKGDWLGALSYYKKALSIKKESVTARNAVVKIISMLN